MPYFTLGQYTDCDYVQQMVVGTTYYIYSPGDNTYSANTNCRWVAQAPTGYNIVANCYSMIPSVNIQLYNYVVMLRIRYSTLRILMGTKKQILNVS